MSLFFLPWQQQPLRWITVLSLLNTIDLKLCITKIPNFPLKLECKWEPNRCQCLYARNIHRLIDNISMVLDGNRVILRTDGNYKWKRPYKIQKILPFLISVSGIHLLLTLHAWLFLQCQSRPQYHLVLLLEKLHLACYLLGLMLRSALGSVAYPRNWGTQRKSVESGYINLQ